MYATVGDEIGSVAVGSTTGSSWNLSEANAGRSLITGAGAFARFPFTATARLSSSGSSQIEYSGTQMMVAPLNFKVSVSGSGTQPTIRTRLKPMVDGSETTTCWVSGLCSNRRRSTRSAAPNSEEFLAKLFVVALGSFEVKVNTCGGSEGCTVLGGNKSSPRGLSPKNWARSTVSWACFGP